MRKGIRKKITTLALCMAMTLGTGIVASAEESDVVDDKTEITVCEPTEEDIETFRDAAGKGFKALMDWVRSYVEKNGYVAKRPDVLPEDAPEVPEGEERVKPDDLPELPQMDGQNMQQPPQMDGQNMQQPPTGEAPNPEGEPEVPEGEERVKPDDLPELPQMDGQNMQQPPQMDGQNMQQTQLGR